jgi:hypothetical protein
MKRELSWLSNEEIAGAVQRKTEEVLTAYIDYWVKKMRRGRPETWSRRSTKGRVRAMAETFRSCR